MNMAGFGLLHTMPRKPLDPWSLPVSGDVIQKLLQDDMREYGEIKIMETETTYQIFFRSYTAWRPELDEREI